MSETIRVVSIVDRFLEHSRVFYFENEGTPEVFIGSADWMDRNLIRRVEVVFPIEQSDLKTRLIDEVMAITLADNVKTRELHADGTYQRVRPVEGHAVVRSQQRFLELAAESEKRGLTATPTEQVTNAGANGAIAPKVAKRGSKPRKGA